VVQEGAPAPKPKRYPRIKGGRTIGLTGHARSWDLAQRFIRRSASLLLHRFSHAHRPQNFRTSCQGLAALFCHLAWRGCSGTGLGYISGEFLRRSHRSAHSLQLISYCFAAEYHEKLDADKDHQV